MIQGMTSDKVKNILNEYASQAKHYLEIGVWKGATLVAALHNNDTVATAIDNFSQFGDVREEFYNNTKHLNNRVTFIEDDCFKIDISKIPTTDVYFYDGGHKYDDQYNALKYYYDCLDKDFTYIVDDWNIQDVKDGTFNAIKDLELAITYFHEYPSRFNGDTENYWNGLAVFKLRK